MDYAEELLMNPHGLEKAAMTRHEVSFKQQVEQQWSFLVYTGLWYDPLREDLDAFIDKTQRRVTGTVRVKLFRGLESVVGRSSPMSLYDANLATYETGSKFNQGWSPGFTEIWGLPTTVAYRVKNKAARAATPIAQETADRTEAHQYLWNPTPDRVIEIRLPEAPLSTRARL